MNIFKILANGDGTINEANISAFLGYLLDPYQDHGLGFEFLERFLERVFENQEEKVNLRSYDYEILFEQAFRDEDKQLKKKEIVDIVILCFESNKGNYKELIAKNSIDKARKLKYIFLIENKVNKGANSNKQLKAQFENTIKNLGIEKSKIVSLYVTPDEKIYHLEFDKFDEKNLKEHYVWKNKDVNSKIDILSLLLELISDEHLGKIEAINEYTRHTLISFIQFIENDFKSQLVEKIENAEGKYKKDIIDNFDDYYSKYSENLNETSNAIVREFAEYVRQYHNNLFLRHTKTHPISVFQNPSSGKIFSCSRYGRNLNFHFLFRNHEIVDEFMHYLKTNDNNYIYENNTVIVKGKLDAEKLKNIFSRYVEMLNSINVS
jgi:hypothetical protein